MGANIPKNTTHSFSSEETVSVEKTNSGAQKPQESLSATQKLWKHIDTRLISGFTPAYYASVMGTGISANILYNFVFPARWLQVCGRIMAVISLTLFVVLLVLFVTALFRNRLLLHKVHCDTAMAPFMGCMVMGYTSLVMFLDAATDKLWGMALFVLWWIASVMSFYTGFVTFFASTIGKHRKSANALDPANISMLFLLPVVTLTVSLSCGGLLVPKLDSTQLKIITMIICFIMWAVAVILAFIVVLVNFWRLFVHKIPASAQVMTMFLPIGFLGQGALAILLFGRNCFTVLLQNKDTASTSSYLYFMTHTAQSNNVDVSDISLMLATSIMMVCTINALALISFGFFFTFVAIASTLAKMAPFAQKRNAAAMYSPKSESKFKGMFSGFIRFHRGFWAMTFPLGTMATSNGQLYSLFHGFEAFRYISAIYACLLFIITIGCLCGVVYRCIAIVADVSHTKPEESQV